MQLIQEFNDSLKCGWPFVASVRHFRARSWVQGSGLMDHHPQALAVLKYPVPLFLLFAVHLLDNLMSPK